MTATDALYGQAGLVPADRPAAATPFLDSKNDHVEELAFESPLEVEDLVTPPPSAEEEQLVSAPALHRTALAVPAAPPTSAGGSAYVRIVGTLQGAFAGNATEKERDGWLVCRGFAQQLSSSLDSATGVPAGRRRFTPIVLTFDWSGASPQLFSAMVGNERLTSVTIEFTGREPSGAERVSQRLTLTNALISTLRRTDGIGNDERHGTAPLESVSLAFERIELVDVAANRTAQDAWTATQTELESGESRGPGNGAATVAGETREEATIAGATTSAVGAVPAAAPASDRWTSDTYELERAGVRPCHEGTFVA